MKILVASDSYKGCLSSAQANDCIERGIKHYNPDFEVFKYSIGDGGEGTMEAFLHTCNGVEVKCNVKDAYYKDIECSYCLINEGKTAVIDVASVIGLNMYPREKRKPIYATSYGVGQLLKDAKSHHVDEIIIGLGGSSTNDCGMGLLNALGAKFYDEEHNYLKTNANNLNKIKYIDLKYMVKFDDIKIIAACDVKNKLLGEEGATYIFGRQKGLFPNQMAKIEKGMQNFVNLFRDKGYELDNEGAGAAGGIGSIVINVLHAQMRKGLDLLLEYNHMEDVLKTCDLVISGEGQSDKQTMYGKVPVGILEIANKYDIPCICISGALGLEYMKLYDLGFVGIYSVADRAMDFKEALRRADEKLEAASYTVIRTIDYFRRKK